MRKKINMYASAILFVLVSITSCDKDEEIIPAEFSITDIEKNFGTVEVEETINYSFKVTNEGGSDLEIDEFVLKGTNAADFSTSAVPKVIKKEESYTFEISFAPLTEGEKEAILEITTNIGKKEVKVTGIAKPKPLPGVDLSETALVFGNVEINQTKDATFTITNSGDADLEITGFEIKGDNAADFSTSATTETLAAGETKNITVVFEPTNVGEKTASLEVTTNAGVKAIALSGKATATPISVIEFSESPVSFGNVEVGKDLSKNITVSNTGNADLEITNVSIIGGSSSSSFTVIGGTSSLIRTIAPGDTYTFEVKFTPSSQGFASGSIKFFNNSSDNEASLPMNGTGTAPAQPAIAFSETGLSFGDVTVGNSSNDLTFAIQNNGQGSLEVSNIRMSGLNSSDFTLVNVSAPQTIAPNGGVYEVTARFTPQSEGQKQAMIVVESNDPTKPSYAIMINGTGLQAATGTIVNIPDANFKTALVADNAINTNGDSEIQVSEAQAYSGSIRVDGLSISDVTGIEAFVNITEFHAMNNSLTSIDLSQNTAITRLTLRGNNLTALDLSANTALQTILIEQNNISSIDLSNHSSLVSFQCGGNNISTLLLPTTANGLRTLYLEQNKISTLDVSMYSNLRTLVVYNNNLTSVDISNNSKVRGLQVRGNNLTSLNVANGNNINFIYMVADNNSNLTCIQHDAGFDPLNPPNTQANQWAKPSGASWSTVACQ
ncbi:choice-of-anchor D domain-containing protein [Tenacibaculum sp. 1_MG-2023]|uniref:choice-of-anchor D domain-containing protein n=1 Tax=Tenacibaculum sp. 1_MG-2023 TaxID=3062653 RepID=UPI0026E17085|nr:choice-of-anchor D domain-containing protein [Tenacibaculum sp. 1_MG-2023]MDO6674910.1 choice-of-anchor D domain-containing protein [Tenacibaculum sp. 1_MG-2023]